MTVGSYTGVAQRVIREFPDDPVLLRQVLNANALAPIVTALAESFVAASEAQVAVVNRTGSWGPAHTNALDRAAERREEAILDLMRFFELREVRGRDVVVRRSGDIGLSVQYRAADRAAGNA